MSPQAQFKALVDGLSAALTGRERFTLGYQAEVSDFVRLNHASVRQAGHVSQASATLKLIDEGRHADLEFTLCGDADTDRERLAEALQRLRQTLPLLQPDPYLRLNEDAWHSHSVQDTPLPASTEAIERITGLADGLDLVGIYAAGPIYRGFASSWGAWGWHEASSFNFDWSLFHANGEAVKANYAGADWQDEAFARRFAQAREQLAHLGGTPMRLAPGQYRAYLAPAALEEVVSMLGWGGFSARALATHSSPLQRLYDGGACLDARVSFSERVSGSLSPAFSGEGYPRRDLSLVAEGRGVERLVGSRSAAEYGLAANGAVAWEAPSALSMGAGTLPLDEVPQRLGTGLYIGNLWYLNYSDRPAARLTGMTRFATFWVEDGRIQAPVAAMRFDDSVYSLLGDALEDLTQERELLLSTSTYSQRDTSSNLLPGALLERLTLTL